MRRSGATPTDRRGTLHVERLEDRTVPAGFISAQVFDGILYVTGDDASNMISVTSAGKNAVVITALDGTTSINGQNSVFVGGVKRGYHYTLGGGDDAVLIDGTFSRGGLNIDMGAGNDTLIVRRGGHSTFTRVMGGLGNDSIELRESEFRKDVVVDTGAGDDQMKMFGVRGRGTLVTSNPQGTDFANVQQVLFEGLRTNGFLPGAAPPTFDTTPPTVTLTTTAASTFNSATADFTATFSEDVGGFGPGGIAVTNGTVSSFTQVDARTYRFSVTPAGQGTVSATVSAGAATDAGGNASAASDTISRTFDSIAPATPTFNLAAASDSGTVGDFRTDQTAVTLTGTATAGSTVTLFSASSGTAPGTGTVLATTTASAAGAYSFNVSLDLGPTSFVVRASDAAGNTSATVAQTFTRNAAPVAQTVPAQNLTVAGGASTLDLTTAFTDAERVVRFSTQFPTGQTGNIDFNLFADDAPLTVANFLTYVNSASANQNYNGSLFHRLAANFVLQGGGFKFNDTTNTFTTLTKNAAVINEPGISNTRGTIAMAKLGSNPNSATNEFFFNLGDNSANLDTQNGGFTVFGQVMNGGQTTINGITQLSTFSGAGIPGAPPFPVRAGANTTNFSANIDPTDLAVITTAAELGAAQRMTFSLVGTGTSDANVATVSVSGSTLTITPVGAGTATITVMATDLDGTSTTTTITVNVT